MTTEQLRKLILQDTYFLLADYKVGDLVKYIPLIGNRPIKRPLKVRSVRIETHDILGSEYELPKYVYSFYGIDLGAYEDQLELFNK